jgi:hypothetical protein
MENSHGIYFKNKDLWGKVNGSIPKPTINNQLPWDKNDAKAMANL